MHRASPGHRVRDIMEVWSGFHQKIAWEAPETPAGTKAVVATVLTALDAVQPVLGPLAAALDKAGYPPIVVNMGEPPPDGPNS